MDEKCVKSPIFTVETVFKDSAEVPVDIEFNMPDYCPEISKILKCRAAARISSKSADDRSISADGSVTVTVIYADSQNTVNAYEYQYPFSKTFETGADITGAQISIRAKTEYINCRAVTERKIDIHGAVGVYAVATRRKNRDMLGDTENGDVELLHSVMPVTLPVSSAEKYILLEEEIEVGNSNPDVRFIIRYDATVSANECKLLAGKAMVKGEIAVNLLYRGDDEEPQQLNTVMPFSQLIEVEGADENCTAYTYADIGYLEIKPKFNTSGLSRSFSLDGKLLIGVNVQCDKEIDVVTDAYSRKYESRVLNEEMPLNREVCEVSDTFNCRREIELPDAVSRISDIWCDAGENSVEFEGDCLIVTGTAIANIIAFDDAGTPVFYEKGIDYEYRFKMPYESENFKCDPQVSAISVNYTLQSENRMEIRAEMAIRATVSESKTVKVVSNIQIDDTAALGNRAAMTVYFAEPGESVWDISRKYLANVAEVKRINGIDEDKLTVRQMILVPAN